MATLDLTAFTGLPDNPANSVTGNDASFDDATSTLRIVSSGDLEGASEESRRAGSAFAPNTVQLQNTTTFNSQFNFITSNGAFDGFTFILHNDPAGTSALGDISPGLGYTDWDDDRAPRTDVINNALVVEFDTFQSGEGFDDISGNSLEIALVDASGNRINKQVAVDPGAIDLNNGSSYTAWVEYNGAGVLSVFVAPEGAAKPAQPLITYGAEADETLNLVSVLGSDTDTANAYVGFTAGGYSGADFNITAFSFDSDPVNTAPVADNDAFSTVADQALTLDVANLLDGDVDADGDALTVSSVDDSATTGSVSFNSETGEIVYTPVAGFTGEDTFAYTVADGRGGTDTAQVTITVSDKDDPIDPTEPTDPVVPTDPSDGTFFKTDNNLFGVDSSNPTEIVKFTVINQAKPGLKFGVVQVDDAGGGIDGTNPEDEGYDDKVLQKTQFIYSAPGDFDSADFLNNLGGISRYLAAQDEAFYKFVAFDSDGKLVLGDAGPLSSTYLPDKDAYILDWDVDGDGASDFSFEADISDLGSVPFGSDIQGEQGAEIINLGSNSGTFKVTVDIFEEADYNNYIGFFQVDTNFEINGIAAGEAGFAEAALSQWFNNPNNPSLNIKGDGILNGAEFTVDAANGQIVVPFLVTDASVLDINNPDFSELAKRTFFSFPAANPDGFDHVRMIGNNIFGFEDMMGGGDKDFDDAIVKVDVAAV